MFDLLKNKEEENLLNEETKDGLSAGACIAAALSRTSCMSSICSVFRNLRRNIGTRHVVLS